MDPRSMQRNVHWFTILTYNLHGPWDLDKRIRWHTDLDEIDAALNLLWSTNLESDKVNLGLANYGRGYTLADKNCVDHGCKFTGPSKAGACTKEDGILSWCEIDRIIREKHLKPGISPDAGVMQISWDDQWVTYDVPETEKMKINLANKRCLGGVATWAINYDVCDPNCQIPDPIDHQPNSSVAPKPSAPVSQVPPVVSSAGPIGTPRPGPSTTVPASSAPASKAPPIVVPSSGPTNTPRPSTIAPTPSVPASSALPVVSSAASSGNQPSSVAPSLSTSKTSPVVSSAVLSGTLRSSIAPAPSASTSGTHPAVSSSGPLTSSVTLVPSGSGSKAPPAVSSPKPSGTQSISITASSGMGSSGAAPSNKPSSAQVSSAVPSSGVWSSRQSSQPLSSGALSSKPGSSAQGSSVALTSASQAPISGASSRQSSSAVHTSMGGSSAADSSAAGSSTAGSSAPASSAVRSSTSSASGSSAAGSSAPVSSAVKSSAVGRPSSALGSLSGSGIPSGTRSSSARASLPAQPSRSSGSSIIPSGSSRKSSQVSSVPPTSSKGSSKAAPSTIAGTSVAPSSAGASNGPSSVQGSRTLSNTSVTSSTTRSAKSPSPTDDESDDDPDEDSDNDSDDDSDDDPDDDSDDDSDYGSDDDSDDGSHSDSDYGCKENDCVDDCIAWRALTFLIMKRPICPCVPVHCDKDSNKPKPTSIPKEKNPECKLFGCECGWMGLGFGPGCPGLEIDISNPCGLFGCNPCTFFGCAGTMPKGIIGYDGYCPGGGCDPCPPELCNRPGCTIAGGCGPKPGPAPTRPSKDPKSCDDKHRTVVTERFVSCTEGFDVSRLPTSLWGGGSTSSTLISSLCVPLIDATVTMCQPGYGMDTTTTATSTKTLTSDAPACTRAPLSLDDDEGNNSPDDPLNTSSTFSSNTTSIASKTSSKMSSRKTTSTKSSSAKSSSAKSSSTKPSSTKSSNTKSSSTKSSSTRSSKSWSPPPEPTKGPMDRNGRWKVKLRHTMLGKHASIQWRLFDPNGSFAGSAKEEGFDVREFTGYIESKDRPFAYSMPFGVNFTVSDPLYRDGCRIELLIDKVIPGCNYGGLAECRPYMVTETYTESEKFIVQTCEKSCEDNGKTSPLVTADLSCQDLNEADWFPAFDAWNRVFECSWKGFD
ncbi:hypothetical protein BDW02DRAFT_538096 [Decorospora gaudefroyi]|uniref:chitinase n=1 Tax=Decorospora gaudefroyi TaxID=184978 RepID=A0A6A5K4Y8_9PLEO|nr:hypothetical protein BDW02DRAFT_538096 [Decorospora gaudefroyi]